MALKCHIIFCTIKFKTFVVSCSTKCFCDHHFNKASILFAYSHSPSKNIYWRRILKKFVNKGTRKGGNFLQVCCIKKRITMESGKICWSMFISGTQGKFFKQERKKRIVDGFKIENVFSNLSFRFPMPILNLNSLRWDIRNFNFSYFSEMVFVLNDLLKVWFPLILMIKIYKIPNTEVCFYHFPPWLSTEMNDEWKTNEKENRKTRRRSKLVTKTFGLSILYE